MFDVGLIVLREVVVYIRREIGAAGGLGSATAMAGQVSSAAVTVARVR